MRAIDMLNFIKKVNMLYCYKQLINLIGCFFINKKQYIFYFCNKNNKIKIFIICILILLFLTLISNEFSSFITIITTVFIAYISLFALYFAKYEFRFNTHNTYKSNIINFLQGENKQLVANLISDFSQHSLPNYPDIFNPKEIIMGVINEKFVSKNRLSKNDGQFISSILCYHDWNDCSFYNLKIAYGSIHNINMCSNLFAGCNFYYTTFVNIDFQKTLFYRCNFKLCIFISCNFSNSNIESCIFDYLIIGNVQYQNTKILYSEIKKIGIDAYIVHGTTNQNRKLYFSEINDNTKDIELIIKCIDIFFEAGDLSGTDFPLPIKNILLSRYKKLFKNIPNYN